MEITLIASQYAPEGVESEVARAGGAPPIIQLTGVVRDNVVFNFVPDRGALAREWEALARACEQGFYAKDWSTLDGVTRVYASPSGVAFSLSKHGDTCVGGTFSVLEARGCAGAFWAAAAMVHEWARGRR